MQGVTLHTFYDTYSKAMTEHSAALFAGAGMSRPAGLADWRELLRSVASDLGLDVDRETDLIAIAQYHVNQATDRSHINQLLIDEFTKDVMVGENHRLIANLPIQTIWTTNYDTLLEDAFREAHRRPDVKITKENLAHTMPRRDVTIYKMHGDISQPENAVLIKDDYERFHEVREGFSIALRGDLVSKNFLFLGYSFNDPNIDYILARVRSMLGQNKREHFCIMKRPAPLPKGARGRAKAEHEYEQRKLELRIGDLNRFSIRTVLINDYAEINAILKELDRRSHLKDIFVSGGAHEFSLMSRDRVEDLARMIGKRIISSGSNLVSGFGLGIGSAVLIGSMEQVYAGTKALIEDRVELRPFPQTTPDGITKQELYTRYREEIIGRSGYCVFLCGNKLNDTTGQTESAGGVLEEFEISKKLGKYPIPVGATGDAAKEIWDTVNSEPGKYFGGHDVKKHLKVLGDGSKSNEEIVKAIFAIIRETKGN